MSSDAALLQEIQRLSGAIDRHKLNEYKLLHEPRFHQTPNHHVKPVVASRKYVNHASAHKKYVNPAIANKSRAPTGSESPSSHPSSASATRELVIDGVMFESSSRKLTRKDLIISGTESNGPSRAVRPTPDLSSTSAMSRQRAPYARKSGNLVSSTHVHKPALLTKRKRLRGCHNMVLDNIKGTRTGHMSKRRKMDKQCRFFTMTGVCQRGLTCPYQHDPEKIAICPLFLSGDCPNNADTCQLSHDPTPSRVPLCHHFANHGRCTRDNCPYPHVRVGPRNGVCRDFAVVGYCDRGIDCDKQHVRECPDFAEKGVCPNSACKLPHVIRANRKRQSVTTPSQLQAQIQTQVEVPTPSVSQEVLSNQKGSSSSSPGGILPTTSAGSTSGTAEEYISLTFEESDDEEDEDDNDDDDDDVEEEGDVEEEKDQDPDHEARESTDNFIY